MKAADIKNKQDLVQFVKEQINVELANDKNNTLNKKRNILYTEIPNSFTYSGPVLSLLNKYGFKYEKHLNENYWIYIKRVA